MPSTSYFFGEPGDDGRRRAVLDCNDCDEVLSLNISQEQRDLAGSWKAAATNVAISSNVPWAEHEGQAVCMACLDRERLEQERLAREQALQQQQQADRFEEAVLVAATRIAGEREEVIRAQLREANDRPSQGRVRGV